MAKKSVVSIGIEIPGSDAKQISLKSKVSLRETAFECPVPEGRG